MQLTIDPSLCKVAPYVAVAVVRIGLAPTARANPDAVERLKADSLHHLLNHSAPSATTAELETVPTIAQWMHTYRSMGVNPKKKVKPTHYALSLRLVKDKKWPKAIGPLVDIYLTNQIKHLMPHGGYDVTSLTGGTMELLNCTVARQFQPLGVSATEDDRMETTLEGETLYQDVPAQGSAEPVVLTRYWNHRDAEPTKIRDSLEDEEQSTKDLILFIESVDGSPEGVAKLAATAKDLEEAYRDVYGSHQVLQSYVRTLRMTSDAGKVQMSLDW